MERNRVVHGNVNQLRVDRTNLKKKVLTIFSKKKQSQIFCPKNTRRLACQVYNYEPNLIRNIENKKTIIADKKVSIIVVLRDKLPPPAELEPTVI